MGKTAELNIKRMKLTDLKPHPENPRLHSQDQLNRLQRSLEDFGYAKGSIVINSDGVILTGHGMYESMKAEGYTGADVVVVDLPPGKAEAFMIADNRLGDLSQWDMPQLLALTTELQEMDIELGEMGFEAAELTDIREAGNHSKYSYRSNAGFNQEAAEETKLDLLLGEEEKKFFNKYETFLVQFSGGRDSTGALWWCKKNFPAKRVIAIYAKMDVEFPAMDVFAEDIAISLGSEFEVVCSSKRWWQWIKEKGFPSIIFRPCQSVFLHQPIDDFFKKFDKEKTLLVDGSRSGQAIRGSKKTKSSPLPSLKQYDAYHPMFAVSGEGLDDLLKSENIPLWKGYEQGFVRTACWCCPGQCRKQAIALQQNFPGLANEIRYWEKRIGPLRHSGKGQEKTFDQILGSPD